MASKSSALLLDTKGFDKMVNALSHDKRTPVLKEAMLRGGMVAREKIRASYQRKKPDSELYKAILVHLYPSGEGAVVRRLYVKGGTGDKFPKDSPYYRSYILNFLEKGAKPRTTKGKGRRYAGQMLNRGSIQAMRFFSRSRGPAMKKALKEMERYILVELAKMARE